MVADEAPAGSMVLADFADDAKGLDDAAFAAKHGNAFLVLYRTLQHGGEDDPSATVDVQALADAEPPLASAFVIWPVRKSSRSPGSRFISVGRTQRNDVVVPDISLSKSHAFFVEERGKLWIQDARSRNGTYVAGARVAPQGEGPPIALTSGTRVRLGAVDVMFVDATGLKRVILDLSPR